MNEYQKYLPNFQQELSHSYQTPWKIDYVGALKSGDYIVNMQGLGMERHTPKNLNMRLTPTQCLRLWAAEQAVLGALCKRKGALQRVS